MYGGVGKGGGFNQSEIAEVWRKSGKPASRSGPGLPNWPQSSSNRKSGSGTEEEGGGEGISLLAFLCAQS